jgi:hypothetical protein
MSTASVIESTVKSGAGPARDGGRGRRRGGTQIVRSPAAWPPAMSCEQAVADHPPVVVGACGAALGDEAEDLRFGLADRELVGDAPGVDQVAEAGVPDLPELVVGHAVGDDPDQPAGPTQPPQRVEILAPAGCQLGHAPPVSPPQEIGRLVEAERLGDRREEGVPRAAVACVGRTDEGQGRVVEAVGGDELPGPGLEGGPAVGERVVEVEQRQGPHAHGCAVRPRSMGRPVIW